MSGIDQYTKLLLHANGTGQNFVDSEITPKTVTAVGDVTQNTTTKKFGAASAYFDGAGDYLSLDDHADWSLGTGDWTIDFWVNPTDPSGDRGLLQQYVDTNNRFYFIFQSSALYFRCRVGGVNKAWYIFNWSASAGTFYHIALVRNGTNLYLFIDGDLKTWTSIQEPIGSNDLGDLAAPLRIGTGGDYGSFYGYIDEFRWSKGIARWTSSFTPPTAEYDAIQAITNAGGIVTAEAFGSPTVLPGAVSVYPESIPSAEAFGSPVILPGQVTIQPPGIESAEIFGSPIIIPDAVTVQPVGILSEEAFGTPVVSIPSQIIQPPGIESAEIFGSPVITPGAVTVQPSGIPSQEAFGVPLITPGAVTIAPPGIPSAEVFGSLSVLPGEVIIRPLSISSLEAFGVPRVYRIPKSIQVALEASRFKVAAETARLEVSIDG